MTRLIAFMIVVLFQHWLFDFFCQPHWMSLRKSKEWNVLFFHAAVITAGCIVTGPILFETHSFARGFSHVLEWGFLNGAAHFGIDAVTSRITSRLYAAGRVHGFFVVIGFDQFLHTALLLASWQVLFRWV